MPTTLDSTFSALADPTRRAILARLAQGEATVGELAAPFRISMPAISRHLRVLEAASLVRSEREGKHRRCRLDAQALAGASDWLESYRRFWNAGLDRLDTYLKRAPQQPGPGKGNSRAKSR
ncbi:MAG TPA: metalloregulator ArsR/SmtB family transcription factor [Steroidobacteraceae bacterium]|jgi:DNA-binding transcriptional ArsR family regulator